MTQSAMTSLNHPHRHALVLLRLLKCVGIGFLNASRHTMAILGLFVVLAAWLWFFRPDFQANANASMLDWLEQRHLQQRQAQALLAEKTPASRAMATWSQALSADQLAVTKWLSRKYKISPEPMGVLVSEAWIIGQRSQISPTLILSIMAIESRFNPFASGSRGNMGLMQIKPEVHSATLSSLGGRLAAFDPLTNLRVGTRFFQSMMLQSNSLEEALRLYGSASGKTNPALYVRRVLAVQQRLETISQASNLDANPASWADLTPAQAEQL